MKSKKVELYACESKTCSSYGVMIEHEVLIVNEYEATYKVLICPKCETRTFLVTKYHPRFMGARTRTSLGTPPRTLLGTPLRN